MKNINPKIGIYKITNPSNQIYIGQSKDIERRLNEYRFANAVKSQTKLYNSLKEYGFENHIIEIVEECSLEELNQRERYWQEYFDVTNTGLNSFLQDCKNKKRVFSDEMIHNMGLFNKGIYHSHYGKKGKLSHLYGKKHSKERIDIRTAKITGVNNPMYGKKKSEETKRKISISKGTKIIDTVTGIRHESIKDAAKYYNINYDTLKCYLNGRIKNPTNLKKI